MSTNYSSKELADLDHVALGKLRRHLKGELSKAIQKRLAVEGEVMWLQSELAKYEALNGEDVSDDQQ